MKICLIVCYNLYSSKYYFTEKLAEALRRKGIEVKILQWPSGPVPDYIMDAIRKEKPDFTASFNQPAPLSDKSYFFENLQIRHLTLLLDPAIYEINLATSPYAIISCVDQFDCQFFQSAHFDRVFFLPHGVERELAYDPSTERTFDVVFSGTCYDPDNLRAWWLKHHSKDVCKVIEDAIEIGLSDNKTPFYQAVIQSLLLNGVSPKDADVLKISYYVDFYMRGIERVELIRSIKDASVHIYGAPTWREEQPIKTWGDYFKDQKNVTIHPPVEYAQSLEILKKTKICLNSMPMFKNGSHERIFASLACGALPLTSDNLFVRDQFVDGEDLLLFQFEDLDLVNDKINYFLTHEAERKHLVEKGRGKVMEFHTWDNRAEKIIEFLNKAE
jgi:spore maturation protein CgeB